MIDTTHLSDVHVLACTLYGTSRSDPTEGILAVACVIRNRAQDGYREVCLTFPCWSAEASEGNHAKLAELVAALKVGPVSDGRYREVAWIATGVINGWVRDVTEGADRYHAAGLIPRPEWAKDIAPFKQCGKIVLYRTQKVAA